MNRPAPHSTTPRQQTIKFAFYGRVSTEDQQDPKASHNWQLTRSRTLIEPAGGQIVTQYFDIGLSRSLPWKRRPHAAELLAALRNPNRGFSAVVIGEPQRAFYGNQFGLTFPLFEHYGVTLWVPEVGGPIDPGSDAHDLVMALYGGMSKGERNRIKIRVRAAMAAQASTEGRYLGGRPPYGYRLADAGPHPNLAKAQDGRRAAAQARLHAATTGGPTRLTPQQISEIVTALGNILLVLQDADPADEAKIYAGIGLRLTYQPGQYKVIAEAKSSTIMCEGSCPMIHTNQSPISTSRHWRLFLL